MMQGREEADERSGNGEGVARVGGRGSDETGRSQRWAKSWHNKSCSRGKGSTVVAVWPGMRSRGGSSTRLGFNRPSEAPVMCSKSHWAGPAMFLFSPPAAPLLFLSCRCFPRTSLGTRSGAEDRKGGTAQGPGSWQCPPWIRDQDPSAEEKGAQL